jgi:hypothetical protein
VPNDAVTVAYVHPNEITQSWHQSLLNLIAWDLGSEGHVARGGWLAIRCYGADGIAGARDKAVKQFLAEKDADWLLWIDTDMGFAPDTVDKLMAVADPVDRPVVGGLCFAQKQHDPDGMGGWTTSMVPTIYDWVTLESGEQGFLSRTEYPVNTLLKCAGTGSACILIHRSVLEKMVQDYGFCYQRVMNPTRNQLIGEDLSFCMRAGALGFPVFVHTGIRTTHFKPSWLSERDFWHQVDAVPAKERTAVLVPAMRFKNAERFMASLRASTGLATVYAIAAPGEDEAEAAWREAGAEVLMTSQGTTFATRMNAGYSLTTEPWVFVTGDDVTFRAGWLDHAQAVAGDRFHVVGTNDLSNPRVTSGEHATHMLIRRSYIDETGASWDGPKNVCHEGYRHWYVDDEMVLASKQRNVWAMALGSVVEHHHPLFGKADNDEVYELGQSFSAQDRKLFEERAAEHAC